ncbi:MAG: NAD(P)/FAD-dependent oxidoreductase [Hymenobacter sp.]|nr:MAG: NAD(P)/FAD-dependent oxidoreductase [Hymenobacter sp.]
METQEAFDAVIVGGSYAGLAAALALGRAIRRVLVLDSGQPCNRQTPHSHNFLTQDGNTPADIAALAKAQVLAYPTIQFRNEAAVAVAGTDNDFAVTTATGAVVRARKLLFATGIRDIMPAIPGFAESWGISVIHCPYCHGYEYRDQPTGLLFNGDMAFEMAMFIRNWTAKLTVFTNGAATLQPAHRAQLAANGIAVAEAPVQQLVHHAGYLTHLVLADGQQPALTALYARPAFEQHCPLPQALGCAHTAAGYLEVDGFQQTSVPGVYAAGDATTPMRAVAMAVSAGMLAANFINRALLVS